MEMSALPPITDVQRARSRNSMFPEAPSRGRLEDAKGRLGGAEQKPGRNKEAVRAFRLSPSAGAEGISALRKAPAHLSSIFPECGKASRCPKRTSERTLGQLSERGHFKEGTEMRMFGFCW